MHDKGMRFCPSAQSLLSQPVEFKWIMYHEHKENCRLQIKIFPWNAWIHIKQRSCSLVPEYTVMFPSYNSTGHGVHEVVWPKVTFFCWERDLHSFLLNTSCGVGSFIQWHIYKRYRCLLSAQGRSTLTVEWFLCSSVSFIWFSFSYPTPSHLSLFFLGRCPRIHRVQDPDAQCGDAPASAQESWV